MYISNIKLVTTNNDTVTISDYILYDLSEDNISPIHNLIVTDESITDFSIAKNEVLALSNPN